MDMNTGATAPVQLRESLDMANKGMIENVCVRGVNGRPSVVSKTTFYRLQEIPEITMDELKEFRQNANKPKVRLDDIPLK